MYFLKRTYLIKLLIPIVACFILSIAACNSHTGDKTQSDSIDSNAVDSLFRILTYNVWYGFTMVPERKTTWLNWMKDKKADVVFLQELNDYTHEKLKGDAEMWGHPYSVLLKQEGFPTGITSRYPIGDIQKTFEGFHHGLMRVLIKGMYFYNIHLHPSNWETRNREIELILADVKQLPLNAKVVLAGDFNTFSPYDSSYYSGELISFFAERDGDFTEHNLNDGKLDYTVLSKLVKNGFTDTEHMLRSNDYTFTGSFPTSVEKPGDDGPSRRLDYVFVSGQLVPNIQRARVIVNDTTLVLSDHLPVIVDLRLE